MNLLLFLLLGMLLTITWFVILDLWNHGWGDHVLGESYRKKWTTEIESGRMPASLRQHIINVLYNHRFGWFLAVPVGLVMLFSLWVAPWVLNIINVNPASNGGGTITVAVISLPVLAFVWFIRAYERDRELSRIEVDHWSSEFNTLMTAACDTKKDNEVLRRTAIRQLQDYLNGAKWRTNQRSNNTAIFELFSSIVHEVYCTLPVNEITKGKDILEIHYHDKVMEAKEHPLILAISAVLKATYLDRSDQLFRVVVSQNNLEHMHFDLLNLVNINLTGLNFQNSTFRYADIWFASLSKSNFFNSDFYGAYLTHTDLTGTDLRFADLSFADMKGAILFNAGLANAKLIGTKLTSAMMMNVDLDGADLSGADLTNTGLKKDITLSKYKNVVFNEDTKWDVSD